MKFSNTHETIFIEEPSNGDENGPDSSMIIIPIVIAIGRNLHNA